jgi:hypothetical protein
MRDQAVYALDIHENRINVPVIAQHVDGLLPVTDCHHGVLVHPEPLLKDLAVDGIVFHDQNPQHLLATG